MNLLSPNPVVRLGFSLAAALMIGLPSAGFADSISISPTRVTIPAGASQGALTVAAAGAGQSIIQVRVMGWKEGTAPSALKPTKAVVASPPITRLRPKQELTVRLVRIDKKPIRGRECYRVLVDTIPTTQQSQSINLRVRHSVPVCFAG